MRGFARRECLVRNVIKQPDQNQLVYEIKTRGNELLDQRNDFIDALIISRKFAKQHKETKIFRDGVHLATSFGVAETATAVEEDVCE